MPDAFIGVDVIVGTRGETPEYFEQAYQFIDGLDVTQLHVFSYSERPGTQALKIEYVVSPEEKQKEQCHNDGALAAKPHHNRIAKGYENEA